MSAVGVVARVFGRFTHSKNIPTFIQTRFTSTFDAPSSKTRSVVLRKVDAKTQKIRLWSLTCDSNGLATIMHGYNGMKCQTIKKRLAPRGGLQKRTLDEQIELEIERLVRDKVRRGGYAVASSSHVSASAVVTDDVPRPMLATEFSQQRLDALESANAADVPADDHLVVQPKLDGLRCLAELRSGNLFSRSRKRFVGLEHIERAVRETANTLGLENDDVWLDGELYTHGYGFQQITSLARSETIEDRTSLEFHVFDAFDPSKTQSFETRFAEYLSRLHTSESLRVVSSEQINTSDEIESHVDVAIEKGYEGVVVRTNVRSASASKYVQGKRSTSLLKLKRFDQEEFICRGMTPRESVNRETNEIVLMCGSVVLEPVDGPAESTSFSGTPKCSTEEKIDMWAKRDDYMSGSYLATVRFQGKSTLGVPRFPVVVGFRHVDDV